MFVLAAQYMFFATISESSLPVSSGDVIVWDLALINPGGHFNTSTGCYTAPIDGYYQWV